MTHKNSDSISRFASEQGDVNTTKNRQKYWETNLSEAAQSIFARDNKYFLHQNLSTPVMNVLSKAYGIYIENIDGKKYMDMHGNGVHNAGFNNPEVIKAVKDQLDTQMSFCPRRSQTPQLSILPKSLPRLRLETFANLFFVHILSFNQ